MIEVWRWWRWAMVEVWGWWRWTMGTLLLVVVLWWRWTLVRMESVGWGQLRRSLWRHIPEWRRSTESRQLLDKRSS